MIKSNLRVDGDRTNANWHIDAIITRDKNWKLEANNRVNYEFSSFFFLNITIQIFICSSLYRYPKYVEFSRAMPRQGK